MHLFFGLTACRISLWYISVMLCIVPAQYSQTGMIGKWHLGDQRPNQRRIGKIENPVPP
jgi:hypothetical protein